MNENSSISSTSYFAKKAAETIGRWSRFRIPFIAGYGMGIADTYTNGFTGLSAIVLSTPTVVPTVLHLGAGHFVRKTHYSFLKYPDLKSKYAQILRNKKSSIKKNQEKVEREFSIYTSAKIASKTAFATAIGYWCGRTTPQLIDTIKHYWR